MLAFLVKALRTVASERGAHERLRSVLIDEVRSAEQEGARDLKNLFDATIVEQVKSRLKNLEPRTERRWGQMTTSQMLAHCSVSMQWALGELVPEMGPLPVRLLGRLIKPMVFRNEDPLRKNSPTVKSLIVSDVRDFSTERSRLSGLIDRFAAGGAAAYTQHPHPFFGTLTPEQWAILMYKHLDHHLRQFGV